MKQDAIPGMFNEMWFQVQPDKAGVYRGQCAELCGRDHGFMPIVVEAKSPADFAAWLASKKPAPAPPPRAAAASPRTDFEPNRFRTSNAHGPRARTPTTLITTTHHGPAKGFIQRWVMTTNHKDIGTMYLVFAGLMFFIGGAMAMVIRAELFQPGLQFVDPQFFNSMTTMHALVMIFGGVMPAWVGLANWMIPMQVGAPDMALPRMNNFSFWILPFAFLLLLSTLVRARRLAGRRLDAVSAADRCRAATRCRWPSSPCT